jgi:hypothetical protein
MPPLTGGLLGGPGGPSPFGASQYNQPNFNPYGSQSNLPPLGHVAYG